MDKTVYVIGHKNPDTDSVVSAAAYAELKRALGMPEARAARAGAVNPQTEYIFDRFGLPLPEFLPDLVPKVEYYMNGPAATVVDTTPLWEALTAMGQAELKALPIVDAEGRYVSLLHYGAFAQNILAKVNPRKKAVIPTSVRHLLKTIKAQPLVLCDEDEFFKARLVVAALSTEAFRAAIHADPPGNKVVLVGDREEVQRVAIEAGVRAMIVTNGNVVAKAVRELAEERRVSILVSPYDTSSTALLVIYSTPVSTMGDESVRPVLRSDWLKTARKAIAASPSRSVPVVDEEGRVAGLFTEGDLIRDPNVEVIMVDHNEFGQAVEGIENYRVLEVIDHHRLGSFSTRYPITFINRVVGSTSTMVAGMYREQRVPLPRPVASILLCGILSDTLVLRSATTTDVDREAAEYLASITDLEIEELGRDIMGSASQAARRPAAEVIRLDLKEYEAEGERFSVSQVEVSDNAEIMERREEILAGLAALRAEKGYYLAALMVTDVTELTSLLFIDAGKDFLALVSYPKAEAGVYVLKDILSRKKQLMPAVFELMERAKEG
ncbi:MAG TPA: putative manganese-dependent inorganic diphosphatase [Spirochaetales bacterium]|nr:putative manganese-dependent inorganic diphosphatase [Spirochaetales bacterium]HRY54138.1 putative manganese-dependent inorganic diphosphatase [Spirochaetia bacterium]HRZ63930.1 putative manganese-dependent inorganic diphosphatase [Spirochaetia bacterium]